MYTVKQLSTLAGVSVRTLHYYDEIGLLKPSAVGQNSYRYYTDEALFRLQQILFFREMELELGQIQQILDRPGFDLITALQTHRHTLQEKIERLQTLMQTIDKTIHHLTGEVNMSKKKIFEGFSEEKQKEYEQQALQRYDPERVKESYKRWNSYSAAEKEQIMEEGKQIYLSIVANMDKGAESQEIQHFLTQWHQHMRYFYEPSLEVLRGLGHTYHDDPDFNATFTAIDPDLPAFLQKAIIYYVDTLEIAWLEQELALLEE
jgi:DNA-binding transcriptional MerR regulator